jgi:ribosomal protein L11 methyltransferase
MLWHEITIYSKEEAVEMISNFLHEMGAGGVTIEESGSLNRKRDTSFGQWYEKPLNDIPEGDVVIQGYFADVQEHLDGMLETLRSRIQELTEFGIDIGKASINVKVVNEEDWANAWKQYYKPVRISDQITIKPTWEAYEPTPEELVIELDPGMAFGTGTHATTSLCLRTIEKVVNPGDEVIDVGTGSGILAIAAAKLGAKHVLALDLDPVAVSSATENTKLNNLEDQVTVIQSDLLKLLKQNDTAGLGIKLPVRVVVANILAEIIMTFVDDVYEALVPGGIYVASGIITKKEQEVNQALEQAGFIISDRYQEEDWVAIVARKQ